MQAEKNQQFGIVIAGHGSRDADGIREFEQLVELVRERAPQHQVSHGYLEFAGPTIDQAISDQLSADAKQVVMVPGILLAATHAKNDLPGELLTAAREHPDIDIRIDASDAAVDAWCWSAAAQPTRTPTAKSPSSRG